MKQKTYACQRLDGLWLAYVNGLPIMRQDYTNVAYRSREAAEAAIAATQADGNRVPRRLTGAGESE